MMQLTKDKYRILHLEDLAADAELVKRNLKENHIDFDYLLIDSGNEYIKALKEFNPDIILCDHSLSSFNSFEALRILKYKKLTIPFIVITGLMSEDAAMAIVKAGADDYILKDRLKRLPYAVKSAINKFRFKNQHKQLIDDVFDKEAESKELLVQLSDKLLLATKVAGIGIWEYLLKENKFIADDVLLSQYGITSAEFIGTYESWMKYVHPDDQKRINERFRDALTKSLDFAAEFRVIWPDGSIHHINGVAVIQRDNAGNPLRFIGTNQDITQRKLAEEKVRESETRLADAQAIAKVGNWDTNLSNMEVIWSEETCRIFGIPDCSLQISHQKFLQFVHPEDKEKVEAAFVASPGQGSVNTIEHRIILTDGHIKDVEERWHIVADNTGKPSHAIGTVQDITERKKAEEKIKNSELRYRTLIEQATDAICIADASLKFIDINQYGCEVLGYTLEEALLLSLPDILFTEDLAGNPIKVNELKLGKTIRNERRLKRKDGTAVDMEVSTKLMEDGKLIMFGHDITERKKAEQLIKESEAKYRAFFDNSMDGILLTVTDGKILAANPAACEIFRMTEEEICNSERYSLVDKTDARVMSLIQKRQTTGRARGELTYVRKDGSKFPGEISSVLFKDSYGQERTSMIVRDISERKQAEEQLTATSNELRQALNDLNKIMNSSLDLICTIDEEGKFTTLSAAVKTILGFEQSEIIGKKFIDFVFKDDVEKTIHAATEVMNGIPVTIFENRYIKKDGNVVPILWSASWDNNDKLMYCIAKDATEKKTLEKALESERQRFHDLFQQAPTIMGVLRGPDYVYEMANPLCLQLLGKKNVIGKPLREVMPEVIEQGFLKLLDGVYATGKPFSANEMLLKIDKEQNGKFTDVYLNLIYQPYRDNEGNIEGIFFFAVDVTEQVVSRKKIEESENRFRAIIEKSTDMKTLSTVEGEFTYVSPSVTKLFGYSLKEVLNTLAVDIIHPDDIPEYAEKRTTILQTPGKSFNTRLRFRHKSGKWVWCEGIVTNMLDEPGINALVSNFRDISEKITSEAEKEFDSNNLNALINNTSDLMWSVDRDFNLITSNQPFEEMGMVNFGKSFIKGTNVLSAANSPEMLSHFQNLYKRAFAGESFTEIEHFDYPVELWTEISYYPIRNGDEVIGAACHSRDITLIKKAEEGMQQLTNRLVLATNSAKMGIWDWDLEKNHLKWDEGMYRLYEIDSLQFGSVYESWLSRLHPEDNARVNADIQMAITGEKDYDTEFKIIRNDLSVHYIKATALVERDNTGKAVRMIGANLDITDSKKTEEENKFKAELLNTIGQATIATDLHGKINFWNKAAEDIYGWTEEEALGNNINELTPAQQTKMQAEEIMQELSQGHSWSGEFIVKGKDGKNFPAFVTNAPVYDQQHQLTGIIGVSTDITGRKLSEIHLKELNKNLQKQARELTQSNEELEQFAYVASHDLQEPLRMVSSFLMLLEKKYGDVIDDKGKKYIEFAVDGAKRMRHIILDLLEFSRASRIEDTLEEVDVNEVIKEIQMLLRKQVAEKSAVILVGDLPVINSYQAPLRQIFQNLISNALKYSRKGIPSEIQISVTKLKTSWQFSVKDNGIGIAKEYFDKIFLIFQRLHNKDEFSGTGIGLAITKKIIENLGGKIWIESEEGKGSTFYFTLSRN